MQNKDQLIRDLATSFGMSDIHGSKFNGSKYDAATGTFYCGGITIPRTTVEKARTYFEKQMEYYRGRANQSTDTMDMFLFHTVAFNAINLLEDNIKTTDDGK